jgi:hypothetical protein
MEALEMLNLSDCGRTATESGGWESRVGRPVGGGKEWVGKLGVVVHIYNPRYSRGGGRKISS